MKMRNFVWIVVLAVAAVALASEGLQSQSDGECTLALVRADRTADGRMLIWKNRDVSNRNQVARILDGPNYRFVGIGYGNTPNEVWGGVNTVGFAVANSNAWNLQPLVDPADDGTIQTRALGTCYNLAQFRVILDETDTLNGGRTNPSCFLAFDSTGAMSVFEADRNAWWEYPLTAQDPNGYLVRANYAYGADTLNNPLGFYRNDRARRFYARALAAAPIGLDSVFRIMRDIAPDGWSSDVFPIPLDGYIGSHVYAYSSMYGSICRRNTASGMVIQGGKRTAQGWSMPVVWFFLGNPVTTVAVPVWPHQTTLSARLTGTSSPICSEANAMYDAIDGTSQSIDTRFLVNNTGGWMPEMYATEAEIRAQVAPLLAGVPTAQQCNTISASIANMVYNTIYDYRAPRTPANIGVSLTSGTPTLTWTAVTRDYRNRTLPTGTVVRYQIEFANPSLANRSVRFSPLAVVQSTSYPIPSFTNNYVYRVKAISHYMD
ncbi:MAG: hypothetical protein OEM52_11200 [bacterium]|nr:hypothetical protein [bacterium]